MLEKSRRMCSEDIERVLSSGACPVGLAIGVIAGAASDCPCRLIKRCKLCMGSGSAKYRSELCSNAICSCSTEYIGEITIVKVSAIWCIACSCARSCALLLSA